LVRGELGAVQERAAGAERVVRRSRDLLARRELLLRLRQLARDVLDIGQNEPAGHGIGDAGAHRPALPVRVMSSSSMSSIAFIARADAWWGRWNFARLVISSSIETPDTEWRRFGSESTRTPEFEALRAASWLSEPIRVTSCAYARSMVEPPSEATAVV